MLTLYVQADWLQQIRLQQIVSAGVAFVHAATKASFEALPGRLHRLASGGDQKDCAAAVYMRGL